MLELIKSQRFQVEYKMYLDKINSITDKDVKSQVESLLKSLVNEVQKIDNQHREMFSGNQVPMALGDAKSGILNLRKKLDTLLKDWDTRNPKI